MATALASASFAHSFYNSRFPNSARVTDCSGSAVAAAGHVRTSGGGPRNQFGIDFSNAGRTWTTALCQMDSDGDGVSNGAELGDPSCTWTEGAVPQFDTGITHPGLDCGQPEPLCNGTRAAQPLTGCARYSGTTSDSVDFTFGGHSVALGTSYIKGAFTWPRSFQGGVLRFDIVNNQPDVVHHMLLYRCRSDSALPRPARSASAPPLSSARALSSAHLRSVGHLRDAWSRRHDGLY
jgi:dopamine beta-monooxygenase